MKVSIDSWREKSRFPFFLEELVDLDLLELILREFSKITGLAIAIIDHRKENMIFQTGQNEVCRKFHLAFPLSAQHCQIGWASLVNDLAVPGQTLVRQCPNGLHHGATAIIIQGEHLGTMVAGQVFLAPPDLKRFREQVEQFDFDPEEYLAAVGLVPVVDEERFRQALDFLAHLATMIGLNGLDKLAIQQANAELEQKVSERSGELLAANAALQREAAGHRETARALLESEIRFRSLIENALDLITVLAEDSRLVFASPSVERLLGYQPQQILGRSAFDLVHPDDRPQAEAIFERLGLFPGRSEGAELRVRHRNGSYRFLESVGILMETGTDGRQIVINSRDVTERRRAEDALRRYEHIVSVSKDRMSFVDRQYVYRTVNPGYLKTYGKTHGEILGRTVPEIVGQKTFRTVVKDRLDQALDGEVVQYKAWFEEPDQVSRYHEVTYYPYRPEKEGEIAGVVVTIHDITEQKRAEAMLLSYQEQLRSLSFQLALAEERERRRLATDLHDQIGQILSVVLMKVAGLQAAVDSKAAGRLDEVKSLLEQAVRETRSLTFDLSPPVLYELGFEAALDWLAERFEQEYQLSCELRDDGLPKPLAEEVRGMLFRAVRELLINVVKHARVETATISVRREREAVAVEVSDQGVGFDPAGWDGRRGRYDGFGLFNIRERLDHMGGGFSVHSSPGRGTRVRLLAPLAPGGG